MHSELEDWKNNWFGIRLGLSLPEIDLLIRRLEMLKKDQDQHFHISSKYEGTGGIGDIEISVKSAEELDDLHISGKALPPATEI